MSRLVLAGLAAATIVWSCLFVLGVLIEGAGR